MNETHSETGSYQFKILSGKPLYEQYIVLHRQNDIFNIFKSILSKIEVR